MQNKYAYKAMNCTNKLKLFVIEGLDILGVQQRRLRGLWKCGLFL